jgi:signal transduction histidine kinase
MDHKMRDSRRRLLSWTWRGRKAGVRTTIMLGFVAVLAISGAALVGIWTEARLLRSSYDSLRADALPAISRLEDLKTVSHAYMQAVIAHAYAAIWDERYAGERSAGDTEATLREVRIRGERLRDSAAAVAGLGNMSRMGIRGDPRAEILSSVELFATQGQKTVELADAGRHEEVPALVEKMRYGHAYLGKVVEGVIQQKRIDIAGIDDVVRTALDRVLLTLGVAGAVAIPLTLLVGWYIANRIARPIRQLRDAAEHLAEGRFAVDVPLSPGNEIGDLASSFREMARRLQQSMDALARQERLAGLGQVAGTMSHELRNPLAVLRATLATLRRRLGGEAEDVQRSLARMDRNIDRCAEILGDLQDFANGAAVTRAPMALDAWLNQVLDEHAVGGVVTVRRELHSGAVVPIDQQRLRRAIVNLVDNAAEALTDPGWKMPAGGQRRITVATELAGDAVSVSVADSGPGIAPDVLPRIFEPLFTTKSFGVGLGLPLVRQIIEQHGGTIDVEAPAGGGTRFVIRLPRHTAENQAPLAA